MKEKILAFMCNVFSKTNIFIWSCYYLQSVQNYHLEHVRINPSRAAFNFDEN